MRDETIATYTITRIIHNPTRKPVNEITDRAKRYRAVADMEGPRKCAICGKNPGKLQVMHLSGDESDGAKKNLAYGCRSCNGKLSAAWKRLGSPVRTRQYNPGPGGGPGWGEYDLGPGYNRRSKLEDQLESIKGQLSGTTSPKKIMALMKRKDAVLKKLTANPGAAIPSFQQYAWAVSNHQRGEHDEGGAIIHATPRNKRIEYAKRTADIKSRRRGSVPF